MNSSMPWNWFAKRLNARMLGTFGQEFRSYLPLFGLDNPKYPLVKPTLWNPAIAEQRLSGSHYFPR
jgi:hypothetical protein